MNINEMAYRCYRLNTLPPIMLNAGVPLINVSQSGKLTKVQIKFKDMLFLIVHKHCEVVLFERYCHLCLGGVYAAFFGIAV
ncbi:MAG: hypothetical protein ACJAV1_001108 [Paraglaciecola sp.]|jgi:hypothetical protein